VLATCINAFAPIPSENDYFRGVSRVPAEVRNFLSHAEQLSSMAVQAGVWTLTDACTRATVRSRLVSKDHSGNKSYAISYEDIDTAEELLDHLEISHHLKATYEDETARIEYLMQESVSPEDAAALAADLNARSCEKYKAGHPRRLTSLGLLAETLRRSERFDEAVEVAKELDKALENEKSSGQYKPAIYLGLTASSVFVHGIQDEFATALGWLKKVVAIVEKADNAEDDVVKFMREWYELATKRSSQRSQIDELMAQSREVNRQALEGLIRSPLTSDEERKEYERKLRELDENNGMKRD